MPDTPYAGLDLDALPRVDIIYSYAGADGVLVDAAVAAGARGLVSAGFAPGSPTPEQRATFERAARSGIVVVQCSRASGRVAPRRRLRETGIVAGEDFTPQKARILLMLALSNTTDVGEIQRAFQSY
jgi:L-asparaginase